jgi:hypothetical protein
MHFTATTPLACVLCLAILYLGPARGMVALFATLPLGSAAAVNLSGLGSVFVSELALLALFASVFVNGANSRDVFRVLHPHSAGLPLLCLVCVAGLGAVFLPRVNAGLTEVFMLIRQGEGATLAVRPLHATGSNIGQFLRFLLAAFGFLAAALVMMRFAAPGRIMQAFVVASGVHIALALLDLTGPLTGLNPLEHLRNAYVEILDHQTLNGLRRLIGGFPEPSAFAIYTIGLYGFWLRVWFGTPRSFLAFAMVLGMMALLIRSTSTAAYFGLCLYTMLFMLWQARMVLRGGQRAVLCIALTAVLPLVICGAVVTYFMVPALGDFLDTIIFDKMQSASGNERWSWNMQALRNFTQTYGMGAGIGSLRASGWPFALLGSVGALGAMLYAWFLGATLRASHTDGDTVAAVQSACLAVLLLSFTILPQPNLGMVFFVMAGVVAGVRLRRPWPADAGWAYRSQPLVWRAVE